ncbi:GTP 3',8-cyclase MoaA [Metabacillus sp. GX 13764]|uniref:GTP 3',8-cyclase MoaA n=1 Tax=Metabacillus kandeliae TaxID=2900151 RepID=UPI001E6195A1|nr:GTP 3',8-cyclase MoaA [Metabacillus kandeliae]MCD7033570.1 GTP 3',8-cyclase MoaA [Metabacillus kandeliae]
MITDRWDRPLKDIRISVIDQCNFRCTYCMPAEIFGPDFRFLDKEELLTFEEITKLARFFAGHGVEKIRLTGGEPLLRKDLDELIRQLNDIAGIKDIALTTNAMLLPKYAGKLKEAGLKRVNVSLDAIEDEAFKKINGRQVAVKPVLKGIAAAKKAGLQVKINMVVKKGMNEDQILPMAEFFKQEHIPLRFIEFMDVGATNGWKMDEVITMKEIIEQIGEHFPLEPADAAYYGEVAKRYRYKDSADEIGIISSITQSFCSSCTRARISAEGKFYTCLFAEQGYDLKDLMRSGASDEKIKSEIKNIWLQRSDRYSDERTEETVRGKKRIEMSYIGG